MSGISLSSPAASNAEYTTGLYRNKTRTRLFISRKEVNQIHRLYPCSFLLCDNIFANVLSEIMISTKMGQRPGPAPTKTEVCFLFSRHFCVKVIARVFSSARWLCSVFSAQCGQHSPTVVTSHSRSNEPSSVSLTSDSRQNTLSHKMSFFHGKRIIFINGRHNCTSS